MLQGEEIPSTWWLVVVLRIFFQRQVLHKKQEYAVLRIHANQLNLQEGGRGGEEGSGCWEGRRRLGLEEGEVGYLREGGVTLFLSYILLPLPLSLSLSLLSWHLSSSFAFALLGEGLFSFLVL
jgi:hypothetical protein